MIDGDVRVNGARIGRWYAHRVGSGRLGWHLYRWTYDGPGVSAAGTVRHRGDDGAPALAARVLARVHHASR